MVFDRELTGSERKILLTLQEFVRHAHADSDSHDYAHVLTVARYALEIARKIEHKVDPFIVVCGALLHDIGKTSHNFSNIHGLLGAAIAEEFLDGIKVDPVIRDIICRIVVRHTPTSMIPPETIEEKIIFDADCLDRLGLMGLIRGFVGKSGSMDFILTKYMEKRETDYEKLHFEVSRDMGEMMNQELLGFVALLRKRLDERLKSIEDILEESKDL